MPRATPAVSGLSPKRGQQLCAHEGLASSRRLKMISATLE
jgi:hypothetical protein|tara:strand:- start:403 stop:522 length:120 start_codon:yes stop_codon:yes gene_type:complete